jgi:hypothetical protein
VPKTFGPPIYLDYDFESAIINKPFVQQVIADNLNPGPF